ncbi:MAG: alpha/beta hydrolase [Crocinitomicaceae bacterium]|nr:alpha/beta hydrolase [Crocinitomicaceae bacterium]MDP4954515.1 alpha/beta hydrolase [Crocinitomicaceae bacterium]MDP5042508.1 alpha/beta hydrolase [Crocinitomicaceae bacterium]
MKLHYLFLLCILPFFETTLHAQIQGTWHSNFQVAGNSLLMDLQIEGVGRDGSVIVSIPDQPQLKPQTMETYALFSDSLWFNWSTFGITYAAKLQGDSLVGNMAQSGLTWKAVFYKEVQTMKEVQAKLQDPKAPFPYLEKEIEISTAKKIKISGSFILPELEKSSAFPLVVMVSGSGAQDRDCQILGHKPFWVLADHLGRNGIASYRYDDRGVGKSGGKFESTTQVDFANDLVAIIRYFNKTYPKAKIYIYGHSEGGMTALRAAVQTKKIAGIIEAASVGTSGKEVLIEQQYLIPEAMGYSKEECAWNQRLYQKGAEIALNSTNTTFNKAYKAWLTQVWDSIPTKLLDGASQEELLTQMTVFFDQEWARQFLAFESKTYLAQLNLPFLVINGSKDVQVPALSNQEGFKKAMSPVSLEKSTFYVLEGANHLFQQCNACNLAEYASLEQTLDPTVMDWVTAWILAQP